MQSIDTQTSYTWSLPVTWQRWRSHYWIRHSRKPHVHANLMALSFLEPGLWATKVYIAGIGIFYLFAPVTLTLTRWPSYTNLTHTPGRYTGCANINSLRCGFRKLSSDRHAGRETSYAWSLPVTWERWRSHHTIPRSRNPMLHANLTALSVIEPELWAIEVYIAFWTFTAPVTLTLNRWPLYTNLTGIAWSYTRCANMNFLMSMLSTVIVCEPFLHGWKG